MALVSVGIFTGRSPAQTLEMLPQSPNLAPLRWFASTDAKHQNNDYFLLQPGQTRRVPLAAGTLERLWSTSLFPDQTEIVLETARNRRQVLLSQGQAQRGALIDRTFTFFPASGRDALANLAAGAALVVTNRAKSPSKWFFQASVRPQLVHPQAAAPQPKSVARRLFKLTVAPGETRVVGNFASPGEITELSFVASGAGAGAWRDVRLKVSCEGQLAVDAPLLSLAGAEAGDGPLHNAVADFNGSRLVLRWPMPFERAQISLQNPGASALSLDVGVRVSSFDQAPSPFRFCAQSRAALTRPGQPVEILKLSGQGALVGLALSIAPGEDSTRRTFTYLEGNESLRADGAKFEGTGTEDFFSSAWYFPEKPFSHRFEGLTQKIAAPPSIAAYRLMIPDAIPFKKSLRFDFEHGNGNNTEGLKWHWTAFWYQKPPVVLPASAQSVEESPAASSPPTAPTASDDRWKIGLAVGAGVILGVVSALLKRRRRRARVA